MIAGSDTTASAIASLVFFLLQTPGCMRRVQEEVDHVYVEADDALSSSKHSDLKYLNACMCVVPFYVVDSYTSYARYP